LTNSRGFKDDVTNFEKETGRMVLLLVRENKNWNVHLKNVKFEISITCPNEVLEIVE
jgi:hypothetical protein